MMSPHHIFTNCVWENTCCFNMVPIRDCKIFDRNATKRVGFNMCEAARALLGRGFLNHFTLPFKYCLIVNVYIMFYFIFVGYGILRQ